MTRNVSLKMALAVKQFASKFVEHKPNGLSRMKCNVRGLLQAYNKAENKRRTQGSASGYLGQPATGTDWQGCKTFLK